MALAFKPDLVIELGRHYGNSTCVFVEAANQVGDCRVVSLCLTDIWQSEVRARVSKVVPPSWFGPLDARVTDILGTDFHEMICGARRVLVLWDAHGFAVAGCVLGAILPELQPKDHVVMMHDIGDTRFGEWDLRYGNEPLWKGGEPLEGSFVLGHLHSYVEQAISALDFCSRNLIPLNTFSESLHRDLTDDQFTRLQVELGNLFAVKSNWCWFSLSDSPDPGELTFPRFVRPQPGVFDPHVPLSPTKENVDQLQAWIRYMEGSPFWKLRNALQWTKPGLRYLRKLRQRFSR